MKRVAFVPARSGSQRIKDKNIRLFLGKPLLSYSVRSAITSGVFDQVYIVTDSIEYADVATAWGAEFPGLRPQSTAGSASSDILWVDWIVNKLNLDLNADVFSIIRPTSPMRTPSDIRKAFKIFEDNSDWCDSVRAVKPVSEHPGKIWVKSGKVLTPLLPFTLEDGTPWHSTQTQNLTEMYVQSAALEVSKLKNLRNRSISGTVICPYVHEGLSAIDINTMADWILAEQLAKEFNFDWM